MDLGIKDNLKMIWQMVKVNQFMLREIIMKDHGKIIKLIGMVYINMQMVRFMRGVGSMISSKERELKGGQTIHIMKEITLMAKNMVKVK